MHRQLLGIPGAVNNGFPSHPYFPLFCLVRAGVHVPPFTDHLAFQHPIQDRGFTPENWKRWLETLIIAQYIREYYSLFDRIFDRRHPKETESLTAFAWYDYKKVEDAFGKQPAFGLRLTVPSEFTKDGPVFLNLWCFGESAVISQWLTEQFTEFVTLEDHQGDFGERKTFDQMQAESDAFSELDQKARCQGRFILSADIVYSKPCFYFINPEYLLIACRNEQEKIAQLTLALEGPQ